MKKLTFAILMSTMILVAGCSSPAGTNSTGTKPSESQTAETQLEDGLTFAQAHDAFVTNLVRQENDQDPIPEPPAGVFELEYYDSKVGELAAYVSSDPADDEKHPMIIWVVGGWGNGIDEFAWSYPEWEDDQTGSAFREAGILMMYPSFRGGNGNPGNYEALFGEVDDIVSAYEYAASLPYVDPDRIYLGGHSTGGTRALLASEYTDKFRAVFAFGPTDEVKYHNPTQFTFDTSDKEEFTMRSPIHWLDDVTSPTFLIEGEGGNASNLKTIQKKSENDNIHCYIVEDADHFTVLAPLTRLVADKILADTGSECTITLTDEELQTAMGQEPVKTYPVMVPFVSEELGLSLEVPAVWEYTSDFTDTTVYSFGAVYPEDNFWDMSELFVDAYRLDSPITFEEFAEMQSYLGDNNQNSQREVNGSTVYVTDSSTESSEYGTYYVKIAGIQKDEMYLELWFYSPMEYQDDANVIFEKVIDSVRLN